MSADSGNDDSLYPIAVLIDELRNEDVQVWQPHVKRQFGFESLLPALLSQSDLVVIIVQPDNSYSLVWVKVPGRKRVLAAFFLKNERFSPPFICKQMRRVQFLNSKSFLQKLT